MSSISGADGCKGGWVVITKDLVSGDINWHMAKNTHDLIHANPTPAILTIDIPIGLMDCGSRECDLIARQLLKPRRASSVFPAPIRPVLGAIKNGEVDYKEVCQIRLKIEGKKMSKQACGIMKKVKEIDDTLKKVPQLQSRVREIHPEVCFYHLAGRQPLKFNKKTHEGHQERIELLQPFFGKWVQDALNDRRKLASQKDDVLDAFAALWTAERIYSGVAQVIPLAPPRDSHGLSMEIVA